MPNSFITPCNWFTVEFQRMKTDCSFLNSESLMKNEYMFKNTALYSPSYVLIGKVLVDTLTKTQTFSSFNVRKTYNLVICINNLARGHKKTYCRHHIDPRCFSELLCWLIIKVVTRITWRVQLVNQKLLDLSEAPGVTSSIQ